MPSPQQPSSQGLPSQINFSDGLVPAKGQQQQFDFSDGLVPQQRGLSAQQGSFAQSTPQVTQPEWAAHGQQPYPEWLERGLETANRYMVQPFDQMAEWAGSKLGQAGRFGAAMQGAAGDAMSMQAPGGKPGPIQSGTYQGLGESVGGMVGDPRQWPFLAEAAASNLGKELVSPGFQKLVGAGFTGQMGYDSAQGAHQLYQNWGTMSPEERAKQLTQVGSNAAMATAGGIHMFHDGLVPHEQATQSGQSQPPARGIDAATAATEAEKQNTQAIDRMTAAAGYEAPAAPTVNPAQQMGGQAAGQRGVGGTDTQGKEAGVTEAERQQQATPGQAAPSAGPTVQTPQPGGYTKTETPLEGGGKASTLGPTADFTAGLVPHEQAQAKPAEQQAAPQAKPKAEGYGPRPQIENPRSPSASKGLDDRLKEQARQLKISPEEAARKSALGAGATKEDIAKIQRTPEQAPGFRWSALSPKEQQELLAKGGKPVEKPVPAAEAAPASKEPVQPAQAEAPAPKGPAAAPEAPKPSLERAKLPSEAPAPAAPKSVGKETDFDSLKRRVLKAGGDQKIIDAIIKKVDSEGGSAKDRMAKAMDALQRYGSSVWKESKGGKVKPKDDPGQRGFASLFGKKRPQGARAAYKTSMEKLSAEMEKLPKGTAADKRAEAAVSISDRLNAQQGELQQKFGRMRAVGKALSDWYMDPPTGQHLTDRFKGDKPGGIQKSEDFKNALGQYTEARQISQFHVNHFVKQLHKEMAPRSRVAITNWIQAGGSKEMLTQRAQNSSAKLRQGYADAANISPREQRVAEAIKAYFDERLQEAQKLGILEHGLSNYVNQIWEGRRTGLLSEINAGKLQKGFKYARERFYSSYYEGEVEGKVPKNKEIGFLVAAYDQSLNEAIAARSFVKSLFNGTAEDGRPLVVPEGKIARPIKDANGDVQARAIPLRGSGKGTLMSQEMADALGIELNERTLGESDKARTETGDYVHIDHPAFRTWEFAVNAAEKGLDGLEKKPVLAESNAMVHPDIADHVKALYSKSWMREQGVTRAILNANAFVKQTILGLPGFHYVQEGYHALAHKVNPLAGDIISGKRLEDAMSEAQTPGSHMQMLMRRGLMLYDHGAAARFGQDTHSIYHKIPYAGAFLKGMQEHLFSTYIPGLKATMAKEAFSRNLKRYAGDLASGKITKEQMAEITAAQANAAFGELNYDWMGRNKNLQDMFRLAVLAPDFTEARGRMVAQALRPYGAEQRAAVALRMVLGQYAMMRVANAAYSYMTTGKADPLMDPKYAFQLKVGKRVYGPRSVASDMGHLISDPHSFIFYRMSSAIRLTTMLNAKYFGGKDVRTSELMKELFPIGLQGTQQWVIDKLEGRDTEKSSEEKWNSLLESVGIQSEKYRTPQERKELDEKQAQRQRMMRGEKNPASGLGKMRLTGLGKVKL